MSTHTTFLEKDYINNFKPRSKVVLEEMLGTTSTSRPTRVVGLGGEGAAPFSSQPVYGLLN